MYVSCITSVDNRTAIVSLVRAEARSPLVFTYAFIESIPCLVAHYRFPVSEDSTIDYSGSAFDVMYGVRETTFVCNSVTILLTGTQRLLRASQRTILLPPQEERMFMCAITTSAVCLLD
jgi:hypothetical protein